MQDRFANQTTGFDAPASYAFAVTPSDTDLLRECTRALYVGGSGSLAVVTASGDSVSFANLPQGFLLPVRATRIMATGTTATQILGLA